MKTGRTIGEEKVTSYQQWPWMVSVHQGGHHICGGAIISSTLIVTAAHCIPNGDLSVAVGIIQQSNLTRYDSRIRSVRKVYLHPHWNRQTLENDLALIDLEYPLEERWLNPICLPSRFELIGIVSYGTDCGHPDHAGIYTRVSAYLDWIESIVQNSR